MAIVYIVYNDSLLFLGNKPPSPPFSLKFSVNCLNTKDKLFAPMDGDRPCLRQCSFIEPNYSGELNFCLTYRGFHEKGTPSNLDAQG